MSIIVASIIFLKKPFDEADKEILKKILIESGDNISETRKGRYWEVEKNKNLFIVDVRITESQLHECGDELLDLNLLPEDAPEMIFIISNNLKEQREQNYIFVKLLTNEMAKKLGGITSGEKYIS